MWKIVKNEFLYRFAVIKAAWVPYVVVSLLIIMLEINEFILVRKHYGFTILWLILDIIFTLATLFYLSTAVHFLINEYISRRIILHRLLPVPVKGVFFGQQSTRAFYFLSLVILLISAFIISINFSDSRTLIWSSSVKPSLIFLTYFTFITGWTHESYLRVNGLILTGLLVFTGIYPIANWEVYNFLSFNVHDFVLSIHGILTITIFLVGVQYISYIYRRQYLR